MRSLATRTRRTVVAITAVVALGPLGARARPPHALCEAVTDDAAAPRLVVLSAFPAELAPLVAATAVEATVTVDGRAYYLGRLAGVRVILGLTGIGLVNAERTTTALLAAQDVAGVVMSGVAGSPHRIGDVVVARGFEEGGRRGVWHANRALLALAKRAAASLAPLEQCTPVPPTEPEAPLVCMPHQPVVVFEKGRGLSEDPFGGEPAPCVPGGGEIFGCDLPPALAMRTPAVEDMETAAVARATTAAHLPFLGVRGTSDGAGDPLGDRGFPAQFADYYRLAARNAAALTEAVVAELAGVAEAESGRRTCRLLARGRWRRAARRLRAARR